VTETVEVDKMKEKSLNEEQKRELCDAVGKLLVVELASENVKNKVRELVGDFVRKNKLDKDPSALFDAMEWHTKVMLKG
jgi:hypothetical protein